MEKVKVENTGFGIIWVIGWMFTIGFVKLTFWKSVLAIVVWPYYIGAVLSGLVK